MPDPTPPDAAPCDDAVDLASLRERVAGQRDLLGKLFELFEGQYPAQLAELRDAAARGAGDEVRRAAHRLVGTLGCFSATRAVREARAVERAAERGDVDEARRGVDAVERAVAQALPVLARLVARGFEAALAGGAGS